MFFSARLGCLRIVKRLRPLLWRGHFCYSREKNHQYRETLKVETDCAIKRKKAGLSEHPVDKKEKGDRLKRPGRRRKLSLWIVPLITTIIEGLTIEFV